VADLVLLDGNPLADIHNVLKVCAVVANGRYFNRAMLDSLDPDGTKPGTGLVALEQHRLASYSNNSVAGTDTTEVPLTEELVARYSAVWMQLRDYWQQHRALMDSAKMYADYPVVSVALHGRRTPLEQVRMLDYVELAAQNPALAEIFKKNALRPDQFWSVGATLVRNALRLRSGETTSVGMPASKARIAAENTVFVKAHEAELTRIGIEF
jgi:hypothetical protein